jgi:hypothetical protein
MKAYITSETSLWILNYLNIGYDISDLWGIGLFTSCIWYIMWRCVYGIYLHEILHAWRLCFII